MNRQRFRPDFETLEGRETPAVAALADGLLAITGTDAAERISVWRVGNRVAVSGVAQKFALAEVTSIAIDAKGGDDIVNVAKTLNRPTLILGGDGNDILVGGRGADVIHGGAGNDRISGRWGNDSLFGGDGDDIVIGGFGLDVGHGGTGTNFVDVETLVEEPLPPVVIPPSPSQPDVPVTLTTQEQELIDLVNQARIDAGLQPLRVSGRLMQAARIHSDQMAAVNYMHHYLYGWGVQYPAPEDRLAAVGYTGTYVGENVASVVWTVEGAFEMWMASSGHRANILNPNFTEIGVGITWNFTTMTPYYTQMFGTPG